MGTQIFEKFYSTPNIALIPSNDSLYNSLFQLLSVIIRILKCCLADSIENSVIDEMSCPEMTSSNMKLVKDSISDVNSLISRCSFVYFIVQTLQ